MAHPFELILRTWLLDYELWDKDQSGWQVPHRSSSPPTIRAHRRRRSTSSAHVFASAVVQLSPRAGSAPEIVQHVARCSFKKFGFGSRSWFTTKPRGMRVPPPDEALVVIKNVVHIPTRFFAYRLYEAIVSDPWP